MEVLGGNLHIVEIEKLKIMDNRSHLFLKCMSVVSRNTRHYQVLQLQALVSELV